LCLSLSCSILVRFGFVSYICFSSLFVHDSQRCFVVCALPHVHLSLSFRFIYASFAANGPYPVRKWTISLDCGPPLFCCEGLDIFHVSIGLFLFRVICYSICHLGTLLIFFPVISRHVC
jgi:hypothetical protein